MDTAVTKPPMHRGRPFKPGVSGNPHGRPKGARNRRTIDAIRGAEASGQTPLEFLLDLMRNPEVNQATRIDAAKAALPYLHSRISATTQIATVNVGILAEKSGKVIAESLPTPVEQSPLHLELAAWEREARAHGVDPTPASQRRARLDAEFDPL